MNSGSPPPALRKRRQRQLHQLERLLARTHLGGDAVQLIVEHVAEPLGEDQRQDVVLVFRRVLGAADRAGGFPDPGFEGFVFGGAVDGSGLAAVAGRGGGLDPGSAPTRDTESLRPLPRTTIPLRTSSVFTSS